MRRRDSALYLVFKITQRLEARWRPINGGLTLMTLLLPALASSTASTCRPTSTARAILASLPMSSSEGKITLS
jgi:hypothetical protein